MSNEYPYSERFRAAGEDWADKEAAASLLEGTRTAIVAQWMTELGDIPVNKAERIIKSEQRYIDLITREVAARKAANLAKVRLKYAEMKHYENQSREASNRTELRMIGGDP